MQSDLLSWDMSCKEPFGQFDRSCCITVITVVLSRFPAGFAIGPHGVRRFRPSHRGTAAPPLDPSPMGQVISIASAFSASSIFIQSFGVVV